MKNAKRGLTFLVLFLTWFVATAHAATIEVTNTADSGAGSLRAAITAAEVDCGSADLISFNIPGAGPHVIAPAGALPAIQCSNLMIDGYTQPGSAPNTDIAGSNNAVIKIILQGSLCGGCAGLEFQGAGGAVRGLAIHSFGGYGILALLGGLGFSIDVHGNYIGTDAGGMTPLGNNIGVHAAQGGVNLGSGSAADRNLISANPGAGVAMSTVGHVVIQANQIGGGRDGSPAGMGNGRGVLVNSGFSSNVINGNFIRHNSGAGVEVQGAGTVVILTNAIHGNGGPGIDLGGDGPTPNDEAAPPYDQDSGPNNLVNHPVITSVIHSGGDTIVSGTLKSAPGGAAVGIQLFHNGTLPLVREGEKPVGLFGDSLDANGLLTFSYTIFGFLAQNVSATAKVDVCMGGCFVTSEFSAAVAAVPMAPPEVTVNFAPSSITAGDSSMLTFTLANTNAVPITSVTFLNTYPAGLVNGTVGAGGTCGGTAGAAPGGNTFEAQSGIDIPAGSNCTLTIDVTSSTPNNYTVAVNAGDLSSSAGTNTLTASGTLTVTAAVLPPNVFLGAPSSVPAGSTMVLAINVQNPPANTVALSGFSTTLIYPAGFTNATPGAYPLADCGATYSGGTAGGNTIGFSGGSVGSSLTCGMVAVEIVAPATLGPHTFTIPAGGFTMSSPFTYSNPSPISITVNVTAGAVPSASVTPPMLAFPPTQVGTSSADQMLTLTNTGSLPVTISDISAFGPFTFVAGTTCAVATPVAPGGNCVVLVAFAPMAEGSFSGFVAIDSDAGLFRSTLSGTGTRTPAAAIDLQPSSVDFGTQPLGTPSAPQRVTLTNTGNADLSVSGIVTTPPFTVLLDEGGRQQFDAARKGQGVSFFCPSGGFTLLAGDACYFEVVFTPGENGAFAAVANVSSNVGSAAVSLRGQSGAGKAVSITPRAIDFGNIAFGATSGEQTFTIASTGFAPVVITRVALAPAATATLAKATEVSDFTLRHDCATLEPRTSCTGTVAFKPTGLGPRSADVLIEGDFTGGTGTVALDGNGIPSTVPLLAFSATRFGFGQSSLGVVQTELFTITNSAQLPVRFDQIFTLGDFVLRHDCPSVLEAGKACSVTLAFIPTLPGPRGGSLVIHSSADGSPHRFPLEGSGCRPFSLRVARLGLPSCGP